LIYQRSIGFPLLASRDFGYSYCRFCLPREACELTHVLHPNTERSTPHCDGEGRHIYNGGIDGVALTNYDYFRILPTLTCHLLYLIVLSRDRSIGAGYCQCCPSLFHPIHLFTLLRDGLTETSYLLLPASLKPVPSSYFVLRESHAHARLLLTKLIPSVSTYILARHMTFLQVSSIRNAT
jgi:hypothetical protein